MRAVIYDPQARANLRLADVDEPAAAESEAVIQVRATALNFGEVHFIDRMRKPGEVPGWDAAGVVVQAAADGSGPPVGSRVVGFHGAGGWAQRRTVPTENLAILPDSVEFGPAAALPVAGVTALQALRRLGPVVGRRVLITGASGGVGRFAVQLAARAGAHVVAAVGSEARGAGLETSARPRWWSASQTSPSGCSACSTTSAVSCWPKRSVSLATVVLRSPSAWRPTSPPPSTSRPSGCQAREGLEPFTVRTPFGPDLGYLVELLAAGEIDPQIGLRSSWNEVSEAAAALLDRRVAGKAVLDVD